MDHAAVEARREKILPGDLLQGIFPPPITLIYPPSSPDATCWTLSNYFRARNFARFIECLLSIRSPETSIPSSKRIRNNEISSTWFLARKREKEISLYILFSKMRASIASLSLCSFNSHRISTTLASSVAQPPSTLKQEQRRLGDDQCLQVPLTHLSRIRV